MASNPYMTKANKIKRDSGGEVETKSSTSSNPYLDRANKIKSSQPIAPILPPTIEATPKKSGFLNSVLGEEARAEYDRAHKDTPDWLKPIGFGLETFNRIPLTNRLMNKSSEFLGVDRVNFDGSKMETMSTGNKAIDTLADVGGNLLGAAMTGGGGGKSLLNATDDISRLVGGKVAAKTSSKLLPTIARGAVDGGASVALEDISKGNFENLPQDVAINMLGGGMLIGGGQAIGDIARKFTPKVGNLLPDFTSDLYNVNTKDMLSDLVTTNSRVSKNAIQHLNAKDMNFSINGKGINQISPIKPKTEVAASVEPQINTNLNKVEVPSVKPIERPLVRLKKERIVDVPMSQRDFNNVGSKNVKSYQHQIPAVKPEIQGEAQILKGEVERTLKAERGANTDKYGDAVNISHGRIASDSIEDIKAVTGASYDKIDKAIDDIIADNGRENNALSKKIELIIDDRLTNGYSDDVFGMDIPPNVDYILKKAEIEESPLVNTKKEFSGMIKNNVELPSINPAKTKEVKDPLSVIEGISVGTSKKEPFKVNYSKMDDADSAEIKVKEIKDGVADDFDVTAAPNQKIVTGTNKSKTSFKDKWEEAYTRMVDIKKPIDKVSKKSYIKATNSANSGSTVEYVLNDALVDKQGKKIGESLKKTLETNIPKGKEVEFWEYALQRHNVARAGQEKPVYFKEDGTAYTPSESQARVEYLEKQYPEWKEKAANISKWIDNFMSEWGVKAGTIDKGMYDELRLLYPDYIPTNRGFNDLEDFLPGGSSNSKGFVDQTKPLNKATGSDRDIVDPTESIMNLVNRTIRTAKYNEVGQSVVKAVRENPAMSKLAEIVPEPKGNVDNVVRILEDGQPVYLKINDKNLLGALTAVNSVHVDGAAKFLKDITTVFKSLITTKNPVFAIRNVMRDIPTYLINSKETNPLKLVGNLGGAVKDIMTNSPTYQQYRALGGGGSNFLKGDATKSATQLTGRVPITNSKGQITGYKDISPLRKGLKAIGGGVEKFNNVIESAPRLAEFKNSVGRGENLDQAMFDAADVTTNFSRGGDIIKQFDIGVPYLNAAFQGLDKLGRQVVNNPVRTALKGATVVTLPVLAMNYVNKENPYFKELDNRTKDNYILLPNVFGEKDYNGNAKTFIKIPKSREYGVLFGSLAERYLRQQAGEEEAFKGFKDTLKTNFAPANPIEDNILIPATNIAIGGNKDFANRDIVPRAMIEDGRSKHLQYDEKTSEITKKIAELASKQGIDLSPKQMDYLIKSYLGVIAQLGLPATTKNTMEGGNKIEKILKPVTTQFVADPLYSNQGLTDFYDRLDKSKQLAADKNLLEQIDSKTVTSQEATRNALNKVSSEMSALSKQLKLAEAKGDKNLVTQIRIKMLQLSREANIKYSDVK